VKQAGLKTILSLALGALAVASVLVAAPGGQTSKAVSVKAQTGTPVPALDLSARKAYGSRQAPITMEVFSDYQCPSCKAFYEGVAQQLMQNYVETGKVYLVHRDFPLPMHSHSTEAARWANAAAEAGVFETVDRGLYATQTTWEATGKIDESLAGILSPADLKKVRLIESTQATQLDAIVARDKALGDAKHVDSTPSIFVEHNGLTQLLPAAGINYSLLKQYLDILLQQH
jgi:protein-disulfide isomerase